MANGFQASADVLQNARGIQYRPMTARSSPSVQGPAAAPPSTLTTFAPVLAGAALAAAGWFLGGKHHVAMAAGLGVVGAAGTYFALAPASAPKAA